MREVGSAKSGRDEQLLDGSIVKRAVLTHIENRQVESEGLYDPHKRLDRIFSDMALAGGYQTLIEQLQIVKQLGRVLIDRRLVLGDVFVGGIDARQSSQHRVDELAPRFVWVAIDRTLTGSAQAIGGDGQGLEELRVWPLPVRREAQQPRQLLQLSMHQSQGVAAHLEQTLPGDLGRYQWMSVPIAADPGAEGQSGEDQRVIEYLGIEPNLSPSHSQPLVQGPQDRRKHMGQVIEHVATLGLNIWFVQIDLAGPP